MVFAHDTEFGLDAAAALVNTRPSPGTDDTLTTIADLDAFVAEWGWTGRRRRNRDELERVRELRPRLRAFWTPSRARAVRLVNAALQETAALPQLVRHDGWDYHLHATPPDAPLEQRMLVEAAMAMVEVIRIDELERLRVCARDGCTDVFADLSKNRSRRFCDQTCGNRTNVAAFRARRAGQAG